jgi:hypothetical protein
MALSWLRACLQMVSSSVHLSKVKASRVLFRQGGGAFLLGDGIDSELGERSIHLGSVKADATAPQSEERNFAFLHPVGDCPARYADAAGKMLGRHILRCGLGDECPASYLYTPDLNGFLQSVPGFHLRSAGSRNGFFQIGISESAAAKRKSVE